jgi:hypothetical protein
MSVPASDTVVDFCTLNVDKIVRNAFRTVKDP